MKLDFTIIERAEGRIQHDRSEINSKYPLFQPAFDGATFNAQLDGVRLSGQLARVYNWMSDGRWRTLNEIKNLAGGSEAGCSARLRDLRKRRYGSHLVHRRRRGNPSDGVWEYLLEVNSVFSDLNRKAECDAQLKTRQPPAF